VEVCAFARQQHIRISWRACQPCQTSIIQLETGSVPLTQQQGHGFDTKMSRTERGVYVAPDGKKTFVPLENNPEVFDELIHKLGVSEKLGFHE
jgi:hypothetical protein